MARIRIDGTFNPELLRQELRATFPALLDSRMRLTPNRVELIIDPPLDVNAITTLVKEHDPTKETPNQAEKKRLKGQAKTAEGKEVDKLNANDIRALTVLLLFQAGAVGPDGKILPIDEWA